MIAFPASAQVGLGRTVGVLVNTEAAYEGYTLFSPISTPSVYLMDNEGRIIHSWEIDTAGVLEAHLLDNGHLVVVAGPSNILSRLHDGRIQEYTWDNAFVWEIQFDRRVFRQHHGIDILPNGNILAIAWKTRSLDEAIEMGLSPQAPAASNVRIDADVIIEIDRSNSELA